MARRLTWVLAFVLGTGVAANVGRAQVDESYSYTRVRLFKIPFQTDPNDRRIREVQLFASADLGRSWQHRATATPEQGAFQFEADRDGCYWFAVRTIDFANQPHPPSMDGARPGLKVCVDTVPPIIDLHMVPSRDGMPSVAWDIRDDNLDLPSLRLDYRARGGVDWLPIRMEPSVSGQATWNPSVPGPLEVRLRARDRAMNEAEKIIALGGATDAAGIGQATNPYNGDLPAPGDPAVRRVKSKSITLNYEVEKGPSGISKLELWITRDGRTWMKYSQDLSRVTLPASIPVTEEGLYGLTLVATSGAGLAEPAPQPGDRPQLWVDVDVTPPAVKILGVDVGRGADAHKLRITWDAKDKNIAPQPITLSYSESGEAPWTPIAPKLENTGQYVWTMPPEVPYKFFVRVEAVDLAGNVGVARTGQPVNVDLTVPKARLNTAESGPSGGQP